MVLENCSWGQRDQREYAQDTVVSPAQGVRTEGYQQYNRILLFIYRDAIILLYCLLLMIFSMTLSERKKKQIKKPFLQAIKRFIKRFLACFLSHASLSRHNANVIDKKNKQQTFYDVMTLVLRYASLILAHYMLLLFITERPQWSKWPRSRHQGRRAQAGYPTCWGNFLLINSST